MAFVDAVEITALRTAATSAMAADRMTPAGPIALALLGSGLEARNHLWAMAQARELGSVRIYSPTQARREALADEASARLSLRCEAVARAEDAVAGAQVVVAAARSYGEEPILHAGWLESDVTIVSIGSTLPEQRELDVAVIAAADAIICDAPEEVAQETGDMIAATRAGIDFRPRLHSLQSLMTGQLDPLLVQPSVRLFKSVGSALQDIVTAQLAYECALARGLEIPLPISFQTRQV
jgi:ornithine cyclodeaminase/alanine dehydrogenase